MVSSTGISRTCTPRSKRARETIGNSASRAEGVDMADDYPDDADGDALRRLAGDGSDMSKPMSIDFQVAVPDLESADRLAEAVAKLGYRVAVYESPGCRLPWTTECSTRMLATYAGVIAIQAELEELSRQFGGFPDGWGSFGNNRDRKHREPSSENL